MASAIAITRRLESIREERAAAVVAAATAVERVDEPDATAVAEIQPEPQPEPEPVVTSAAVDPSETPAPDASAAEPPARVAPPRLPALEAFDAAIPQLRRLGHPRLSADGRAWPLLRRAAQRAMFRVIRPYWYQQRQFQDALLEAVHASIERLTVPGDQPTSAIADPTEPLQPLEPGTHERPTRG